MKKLLSALVAAVFMTGVAGLALADEKKANDKGHMDQKMAMKARIASGTVKTAAADSIVVTGKEGKGKNAKEVEWTFSVDDKTMIKKGGKAITAADLKAGDSIHVKYMEHDGKMVAERVTVKGGGKGTENPCAGKK